MKLLHAGTYSSGSIRALGLLVLLLGTLWSGPGFAQAGISAPVLHISGAIGPATADYIVRGIDAAADEGALMLVLQIDTPGGLDTSMREIIRAILRSPVPVISYVAPSGARAASAGTFILYASHVAAMAPGTNVGSATPVPIGGPAPVPKERGKEPGGDRSPPSGSAPEAKAVNDAVAYLRSLAELRGRNATWAEAAVRSAANLPATAALEQKVIDLVARDRPDLLKQLDGRTVMVGPSRTVLQTRNVRFVDVEPNWRTQLLAAITDPNIALFLMMIGVYGLMFEFMNPGALYPGTIGAICLVTGLYALAALPVSYAGAALMLLGAALVVGEAFAPSFGVLGLGGLIAFALGATILIDTDLPQFRINPWATAAAGIVGLVATAAISRLAVVSQQRKVVTGRESLIGAAGTVLDWQSGHGHVLVHGERWTATGMNDASPGQAVHVTALDGLTLLVEPVGNGGHS